MSGVRLGSDIWVSAYMRRCRIEGAFAYLRRRGAEEAGAIFVKVDSLDGMVRLFGPAPQYAVEDRDADRLFVELPLKGDIPALAAEERLQREISFDPDLWVVEVEDRQGRHFLDVVEV